MFYQHTKFQIIITHISLRIWSSVQLNHKLYNIDHKVIVVFQYMFPCSKNIYTIVQRMFLHIQNITNHPISCMGQEFVSWVILILINMTTTSCKEVQYNSWNNNYTNLREYRPPLGGSIILAVENRYLPIPNYYVYIYPVPTVNSLFRSDYTQN